MSVLNSYLEKVATETKDEASLYQKAKQYIGGKYDKLHATAMAHPKKALALGAAAGLGAGYGARHLMTREKKASYDFYDELDYDHAYELGLLKEAGAMDKAKAMFRSVTGIDNRSRLQKIKDYAKENPKKMLAGAAGIGALGYGAHRASNEKRASYELTEYAYELGAEHALEKVAGIKELVERGKQLVQRGKDKYQQVKTRAKAALDAFNETPPAPELTRMQKIKNYIGENPYKVGAGAAALAAGAGFGAHRLLNEKKASFDDIDYAYGLGYLETLEKIAAGDADPGNVMNAVNSAVDNKAAKEGATEAAESFFGKGKKYIGEKYNQVAELAKAHPKKALALAGVAGLGAGYGLHRGVHGEKKAAYEEAVLDKIAMLSYYGD